MRALVTLISSLLIMSGLHAQQNDILLNRDVYIDVERNAARLDTIVHVGLKPLLESRADLTNVMGHRVDSAKYFYWHTVKLFRDHLFEVIEGDVRLTLDPLFQQEYGQDFGDQTSYSDTTVLYFNSRGFVFAGDIGSRVSFRTMFHESRGALPSFMFQRVRAVDVLSGQGRVKYFDGRKVDYGWSQANISVAVRPWLNAQLGHGKHFVGHGYRSVLLSDYAPPAPYVKLSALTRDRRLQYSTWHTRLLRGASTGDRLPTGESSEALFRWMRARFHHVSLNLGRAQIGLFEATVFRNIDDSGVRPFNLLELNPIIGLNTVALGFGNPDKCLTGADARVKITDKLMAYGQLATDKPGRYAWQAGLRAFDVGRKDLHLQAEFNTAMPFMYMNDPPEQAYLNQSLPLAHPLGTSFREVVAIADAGFGRFWLQAKVNLAQYEREQAEGFNHGTSLNQSDVEERSEEGPITRQLTFLDLNASYLFNPNTNLRLVAGFWRRDVPGESDGRQSSYLYVALRTALFNRYYDL